MPKLRAVIVGAGRSGSKLMLQPLQALSDRVEVIGICDPDENLVSRVAQVSGLANFYGSLEEALDRESIDLVCVSTPPATHFELSKLAMERGCNVVVEKPLTNTIEEARELKAISERTGKKLTVVHNHKFRKGIIQGMELFRSGVTGQLLHVHVNWVSLISNRLISDPQCWVHKVKGGAFKEVLPHILYNTYQFVGEMEFVDVLLGKKIKERDWMVFDEGLCRLQSKKCAVTVYVSFNGERGLKRVNHPVQWTLQGDKGVLCVNHYRSYVPHARRIYGVTETVRALASGLRTRLLINHKRKLSDHGQVLLRFIDHVQKGAAPPVSWDEALHVMELTDAICDEVERKKSNKIV
jgi:predicted dehydrogenase